MERLWYTGLGNDRLTFCSPRSSEGACRPHPAENFNSRPAFVAREEAGEICGGGGTGRGFGMLGLTGVLQCMLSAMIFSGVEF